MSNHKLAQMMTEQLNSSRRKEEEEVFGEILNGRVSKGYRNSLIIASILGIGLGLFLIFYFHDIDIGLLFFCCGLISLLMLPTCLSYRCSICKEKINIEYLIFCFKKTKEVLWQDIKYKKIKRDPKGNATVIRLYNINKKKLVSFDSSIIGFGYVIQLAKNKQTLRRH